MSVEAELPQAVRAGQLEDLYEKQLLPRLASLEELRRKARNLVTLAGLGAAVFVVSIFAFDSLPRGIAVAGPGLGGALALCAGILGNRCWRAYRKQFKQDIVREVFLLVDPGLVYVPDRHISEETYKHSELYLNQVDRFTGDDYVSGTRGETEFEFSEIHAEYKTESRDSKGNTRTTWHTIFRGIFFHADFHKHIQSETFVLPDTAEGWLGKTVGQFFQSKNFRRDELVRLEDEEFERSFCVYSDDQIDARYILTPDMMRRILDLKRKVGRKVALAFKGSRVYVAVSYAEELFEPKLYGSGIEFAHVRTFHAILEDTLGIVDDLNLNTRIWTKR